MPVIEPREPAAPPPLTAEAVDRQHDRQVFAWLLGLYAMVLLPILRANRYFNDDLKRALVGRAGWDSNGRPLTTLLMRTLQCYDHAMVDISPLPQVGAALVLCWLGVLIARRFAIRSPWIAALLAFPLGGQPFFLENLSYKFDALSMSLAMLLALLPMLAVRPGRRGWWSGVLALIGSLALYQPAINVYLVFVWLELVMGQLANLALPRLIATLGRRAAQAALAMAAYQLLIGMHISGWVRQHDRAMLPTQLDLPGRNILAFYRLVAHGLDPHWWMYFGPLLVLLAMFPVAVAIRYANSQRGSQPPWIRAGLVFTGLLLPGVALLTTAGPMLLLQNPELQPRVMVGIGALLVAALLVVHAVLTQWQVSPRWMMAIGGMLALGMGVVASAYGNALGEQRDFEARIGARLADDLADLAQRHPLDSLLIGGSAGYAPATAHAITQVPLIGDMILPYLSEDHMVFTRAYLMFHLPEAHPLRITGGTPLSPQDAAMLAASCQRPAWRTTASYSLRLVGTTAVVRFRAGWPLSHGEDATCPP